MATREGGVGDGPTDVEVRAYAEKLCFAKERAAGALMPFGLGWLRPEERNKWLEQARTALLAARGNA